jgi:pyridoxamine 5'-phosphate oxidase
MDGDQPRVRGMLMWFASPEGFYFHTGATKQLCRQLKANPKTEIYFYAPDEKGGTMLRITGTVEMVSDVSLRRRLLAERPFLKDIVRDEYDPLLVVFRIAHGQGWFWTLQDNMKESQIPRVRF